MLVLSRKEGEKISIDNGRIVITVVKFERGQVRIGIEAPREISVHRQEIQELVEQSATSTDGDDDSVRLAEIEAKVKAKCEAEDKCEKRKHCHSCGVISRGPIRIPRKGEDQG